MYIRDVHEGIAYEVKPISPDVWEWSFIPPFGPRRSGKVIGGGSWGVMIVKRAIEVWKNQFEGAEPRWSEQGSETRH